MARRSPAPFDVMRDAASLTPRQDGDELDGAGLAEPSWTAMAHRAVTVRIPPGFLVLAIAGLLAMLAVVYLSGRKHGYSEGFAAGKEDAQQVAQRLAIATGGQRHAVSQVPLTDDWEAGGDAGQTGVAMQDTRVAGLNYFILAREPEAQAKRLVAFLASRGVEAIAIPINNSSLYHVVDLRGFAREAIESESYARHVRRLAQLGREWKDRHDGPTDFGTMWLQKYSP